MPLAAYTHGVATIPLLGETISANLRRTVEQYPDDDALVDQSNGRRLTYRQVWDQIEQVALGLVAHGWAKCELRQKEEMRAISELSDVLPQPLLASFSNSD